MSKIPTAEEQLMIYGSSNAIEAMIEFAKLHVQAALLAAEEEVDGGLSYVYPLENIK